MFTAVKRKKLCHFRCFRALKFEPVQKFTSAKFVSKRWRTCSGKLNFTPAKLIYMTVTSFPTHTQRKKLKFLETALSFAVKVKLSTFVCMLLCKIMAGTGHASCV